MNGPELLQALMDAAGENAHGIAVRLKQPSLQSYIWKFTNGKAKEPRRSSLQPLAEHYRVPLEAFYDSDIADQVAADRNLISGPTGQKPHPTPEAPSELAQALDVLTKVLQGADESVLMAVKPLLASMADSPATAKNKSELILKLLVADRDKRHESPQYRMRQSHISADLGVLDLGDKNGRRDTDKSAGTGKE